MYEHFETRFFKEASGCPNLKMLFIKYTQICHFSGGMLSRSQTVQQTGCMKHTKPQLLREGILMYLKGTTGL